MSSTNATKASTTKVSKFKRLKKQAPDPDTANNKRQNTTQQAPSQAAAAGSCLPCHTTQHPAPDFEARPVGERGSRGPCIRVSL
jgi:hypothetical protein